MLLLAAIFGFGLIIFIHELGHFWAARRVGVRVNEFSIGMGTALYSRRFGETTWSLRLLPLGGYVNLEGEGFNADDTTSGPNALVSKTAGQKALVLIAGILFNLISAFLIFAAVPLFTGLPDAPDAVVATVVEDALPASATAWENIPEGTHISRVNGVEVEHFYHMVEQVVASTAAEMVLEAQGGEEIRLPMPASAEERIAVARALVGPMDGTMGFVHFGSPAESAGMRAGDVVKAVDGKPIRYFGEIGTAVGMDPGATHRVVVERNGKTLDLEVTTVAAEEGAFFPAQLGVLPVLEHRPVGIEEALVLGSTRFASSVAMTWDAVSGLLTGRHPVDAVSGPVTIVRSTARFGEAGLSTMLIFLGVLSVNIGLMNLLPIPVLDGGHLFLLGVEKVARRPLSPMLRTRLMQGGLVIVIGLMGIGFKNDLEPFVRPVVEFVASHFFA